MPTHTELLELSHDIVPWRLREEARRLDDAERRRNAGRPYTPPPTVVPPPRAARRCVGPMARIMVERSAASGACGEADLVVAGFTAAEIALHGEAARVLAARHTADRQ
jgi:hypothetical protein